EREFSPTLQGLSHRSGAHHRSFSIQLRIRPTFDAKITLLWTLHAIDHLSSPTTSSPAHDFLSLCSSFKPCSWCRLHRRRADGPKEGPHRRRLERVARRSEE